MKIFLSSLSTRVIEALFKCNHLPNVLITFYGLNNPTVYTEKYRNMINGLILDCGAFSLNNLKLSKNALAIECNNLFRKYIAYTSLTSNHYDFLFSFDDEFGPDSFEHNYERLMELKNAGIHAVPVIHNIQNFEADFYIDKGYKMVAIGQCKNQKRTDLKVLWPVVDKLASAGVKVHLFGITTPNIIMHVPAYSCDSKTWVDYANRGRVIFYNPESLTIRKTDTIYFPDKQTANSLGSGIYYHDYKYLDNFREHIKTKLNLDIRDLLGNESQINMQIINALYFIELEERIRLENQQKGISFH